MDKDAGFLNWSLPSPYPGRDETVDSGRMETNLNETRRLTNRDVWWAKKTEIIKVSVTKYYWQMIRGRILYSLT